MNINYDWNKISFASQGWECPKCGRINAPWMPTCPCYQDKTKTFTTDTDSNISVNSETGTQSYIIKQGAGEPKY